MVVPLLLRVLLGLYAPWVRRPTGSCRAAACRRVPLERNRGLRAEAEAEAGQALGVRSSARR